MIPWYAVLDCGVVNCISFIFQRGEIIKYLTLYGKILEKFKLLKRNSAILR